MQHERQATRETHMSDEQQRAVNQREADTARRMKHNKYQRDKHTKQERSASCFLADLPPSCYVAHFGVWNIFLGCVAATLQVPLRGAAASTVQACLGLLRLQMARTLCLNSFEFG